MDDSNCTIIAAIASLSGFLMGIGATLVVLWMFGLAQSIILPGLLSLACAVYGG